MRSLENHGAKLQVYVIAMHTDIDRTFQTIIIYKSILNTALQIGFLSKSVSEPLKQAFLLRKIILKNQNYLKIL